MRDPKDAKPVGPTKDAGAKDVDDAIRDGFDFKLGEVFRESQALLNKHLWLYIGAFLLCIGSVLLIAIPYVGIFCLPLVTYPLVGGLMSMFLSAYVGNKPQMKALFSQFSGKYLPYIGATFIQALVVSIPGMLSNASCLVWFHKAFGGTRDLFGDMLYWMQVDMQWKKILHVNFTDLPFVQTFMEMEPAKLFAILATSFLVYFVLMVFTLFIQMLIIDRTNRPIEALCKSALLAKKRFWKLFLLGWVVIALNNLGALPVGLGLIYTMPMSIAMLVIVYAKAVGVKKAHAETPSMKGDGAGLSGPGIK
ncbi:MAG: hypothetical protein WC712_02075 [Candidatus Brocadiia bacterium]